MKRVALLCGGQFDLISAACDRAIEGRDSSQAGFRVF
jgi:hypothetical protein